jgi:hypothetical protein
MGTLHEYMHVFLRAQISFKPLGFILSQTGAKLPAHAITGGILRATSSSNQTDAWHPAHPIQLWRQYYV